MPLLRRSLLMLLWLHLTIVCCGASGQGGGFFATSAVSNPVKPWEWYDLIYEDCPNDQHLRKSNQGDVVFAQHRQGMDWAHTVSEVTIPNCTYFLASGEREVQFIAGKKKGNEDEASVFFVAGTHTYFVGDVGLWVHNSCGTIAELDKLAEKFLNTFSKTIKKNEIAEWWAKGYPKFFQRGTFFERLMAKSTKYSKNLGWVHTSHNHQVIDFYRKTGGKYEVVSMKTTYQKSVSQWMSSNADHLEKLNKLDKKLVNDNNSLPEMRKLHIYVEDELLSNYSNWISKIREKYKNIEVEFSSIEKEFGL
jgi:hypothetical protein